MDRKIWDNRLSKMWSYSLEGTSGGIRMDIDEEMVEGHWKYTEQLLRKALQFEYERFESEGMNKIFQIWINICHYLYTEAMKHGWKHREEVGDLK